MKKVLFIDRDGTLVIEPPETYQIDSLEKLEFYPLVFQYLSQIVNELDYELVIVTNQDGLGTKSFPEEEFLSVQNKIIKAFKNEGIVFSNILIDKSLPEDNASTRKPKTGMLTQYIHGNYDLANSFVIGDRLTDMQLAKNLGAKGIFIGDSNRDGFDKSVQVLHTENWKEIYEFLKLGNRKAVVERKTKETEIFIKIDLNGNGKSTIKTGIGFFNHMLEQVSKHGLIDLEIEVKGDLDVDEHHTIEDTAIALGTAFKKAIGNKLGIERFGFCLPMDDCLAQAVIDFGGRNWIEWDVEFKREMIGEMPTEMFFHFFKSFTDSAECNLNIKAYGKNEHHKIESVFKAFAKAIKMAIKQDKDKMILPTTKGML
ncbi:MAG: bifunctional histidinol-phosphatase/imidazoleglycerol-phosphate dehydratase HisB [Bacteroidetes bacterium]|nr:bifunctional histidinol-phosphatase/imidazoleglycerol-phosphate dehydratase HisB [Bacteroidota bacterium]